MSMSALDSMVRVHRWILDEKRRKLVDLERFVMKMREELADLDEQVALERQTASQAPFESRQAYASFHAAAVERRRRLQTTIDNLQREVDAAREEVNEAFGELKGYEGARENAIRRQLAERARRDQLVLDETSIGIYRRSNGPKVG
jgi:flagellar export protein FliJ